MNVFIATGRATRLIINAARTSTAALASLVVMFTLGNTCARAAANASLTTPRPVPRMQVIPLPGAEISFQRDGVELTRYLFATNQNRPFLFPVNGPSGRTLTRLGHPHDPVTHSHHNSIWISHHDVDGLSSWDDSGHLRIVHQRIEEFSDSDDTASVVALGHWQTAGGEVRLVERRRLTVQALPKNEWLLIIDLQLAAREKPVTFGKTPFGLIGVRMAKTIGVTDGGGVIRNSQGGVNEKEVFWKSARWVDYSGPITPRAIEGITLFDHPLNPGHPAVFHVRDDGWMGASLTFEAPRTVSAGRAVSLRYGLYVHAAPPAAKLLQKRWEDFTRQSIAPWPSARK